LKFRVETGDGPVAAFCSNVSSSQQEGFCFSLGGSGHCPVLCETCGTGCVDSELTFEVEVDGDSTFEDCTWVSDNSSLRCEFSGVADTCRQTCQACV